MHPKMAEICIIFRDMLQFLNANPLIMREKAKVSYL